MCILLLIACQRPPLLVAFQLGLITVPICSKLKSRFNVRSIESSYDSITDWFDTPLGRRLLKNERRALSDKLRYRPGYHLMQLSSVHDANLYRASRINHCFSLAPYPLNKGGSSSQPRRDCPLRSIAPG